MDELKRQVDEINFDMAMKFRHERDFWQGRSEVQQGRAIFYKMLFAISLGFNIAYWVVIK